MFPWRQGLYAFVEILVFPGQKGSYDLVEKAIKRGANLHLLGRINADLYGV
jgi:hypothetical protein